MSDHTSQTQSHTEVSSPEHHVPSAWELIAGSNLLNVLILAIAMIYLGNKFIPKLIDERKKQISKELEEAKLARVKANEELELIKEKTRRVSSEIEQIKEEAKKTAASIKKQIEQDTDKELENLKLKVKKEITSSQEETIQNIKQSASETAIKLAEQALSKLTNDQEVQKRLVSDFISELDNPSKN